MNPHIYSKEIKKAVYQLLREAAVTLLGMTTLSLYSYSHKQKLTR